MKPLNYDNSPCSPTSSNCVIWQGPNLHCIKLCTGDTISDVIANLATELCTVMDQLSITNYDLSCFNLVGCKPETYQELLQFLIEQICLAQGISPTTVDGKSNDALITVAPCFIVNGITVMSLTDYVIAIGLRICNIIDQISIINNTLNELDIRVTILENAVPPTYTLPSITSDCILQNSPQIGGSGSGPVPLDQLLSILINDDNNGYCALRSATGLPVDLVNSVLSQCILNTDLQLSNNLPFSNNPNWESNWNVAPTITVASSINNIWVALCDIYNYLNTPQGLTITETVCQSGISDDADIYGYIDSSSGPYNGSSATAIQNRAIVCSSLNAWFVNYQLANPSYTGNLYIFSTPIETYLSHPNSIKLGLNFSQTWLNPADGTTTGAVVPPGYAPGWAGPTAMLFVAFVNESNAVYHSATVPPSLISPAQPTATWTSNFNTFVLDYNTYWSSFNAVIYPAYAASANEENFLLQAYAATNNVDISLAGLSGALGVNYNSALTSFGGTNVGPGSNVYLSASQGLWNYGWGSILNKAVDGTGLLTFTTVEFETDLNNLLIGDTSCNSESLIESWDPISQSLVLRQITSCCLDLSVTSEGCLSIECAPGSLAIVEAGSNIVLQNNTIGTTTTYTVNSAGLDYYFANVLIGGPNSCNTVTASIPSVSNAPGKTVAYGGNNYSVPNRVQDVLNYNYVDSNGTYVDSRGGTSYVTTPPTSPFLSLDNATGIFTISEAGEYSLTMSCSLKASQNNDAYWKTTGTDGRFDIGICSGGTNSREIFAGASKNIVTNMDSNVLVTAQCTTLLEINDQVIFRLLNLTDVNYNGGAYGNSDSISVSIVKLRDL
jgi:hypothetical protein